MDAGAAGQAGSAGKRGGILAIGTAHRRNVGGAALVAVRTDVALRLTAEGPGACCARDGGAGGGRAVRPSGAGDARRAACGRVVAGLAGVARSGKRTRAAVAGLALRAGRGALVRVKSCRARCLLVAVLRRAGVAGAAWRAGADGGVDPGASGARGAGVAGTLLAGGAGDARRRSGGGVTALNRRAGGARCSSSRGSNGAGRAVQAVGCLRVADVGRVRARATGDGLDLGACAVVAGGAQGASLAAILIEVPSRTSVEAYLRASSADLSGREQCEGEHDSSEENGT